VLDRNVCEISRRLDATGDRIWSRASPYTDGNGVPLREKILLAALMDLSSVTVVNIGSDDYTPSKEDIDAFIEILKASENDQDFGIKINQ